MTSVDPTYIEFAGLPETGKTTIIEKLSKRLSNQGIQCEVISSASSISPLSHLRSEWIFDAWIVSNIVKDLLEDSVNAKSKFIIFDRGLVDTLCWIEWFKARGEIEDETAKAIEHFSRIPEWFNRIRLVIVLQAKFETALQRREQAGRIVNAGTYKELSKAYKTVLEKLGSVDNAPSIYILDTDNLPSTEICNLIFHKLKELGY